MNLFDQLVDEALKNQPKFSTLRPVIEKELLHHDILRILSQNQLLTHLIFIGGTCLRSCYGGVRLSEDLDFTGGADFSRNSLSDMGQAIIESLNDKYALPVKVSEPKKEKSNVDTWKIKIETRPKQLNYPSQRIHLDICSVPSYETRPMLLLNPYGVDMGTSGLVIQAQSREEIYSDKLLAFAFRPNRIKYRDIWDIAWLHQNSFKPKLDLIPLKLEDHNQTFDQFINLFEKRRAALNQNKNISKEFEKEMRRFLPANQIDHLFENDNFWLSLTFLFEDLRDQLIK